MHINATNYLAFKTSIQQKCVESIYDIYELWINYKYHNPPPLFMLTNTWMFKVYLSGLTFIK